VVLVGKEGTATDLPQLGPVSLIERASPYEYSQGEYRIRRLLNPRDESIDLGRDDYTTALAKTQEEWSADAARSSEQKRPEAPSGPMIRQVRKDHALLLVYLIDPALTSPAPYSEDIKVPIVGFGVSFPGTAGRTTVRYRVNNVFWEQEYGAAA
jgi:hypothetical protein